jgi:hypothetical protein
VFVLLTSYPISCPSVPAIPHRFPNVGAASIKGGKNRGIIELRNVQCVIISMVYMLNSIAGIAIERAAWSGMVWCVGILITIHVYSYAIVIPHIFPANVAMLRVLTNGYR